VVAGAKLGAEASTGSGVEAPRDLLLWRHADAGDPLAGDPAADLDRALSRRGLQQAEAMAAWLRSRLPAGAELVASPSRRTRETAGALAPDHRTDTALAPSSDRTRALGVALAPGEVDARLIVGHQPVLGQLAAMLLTGQSVDWTIRKGAVWWFRWRGDGPHQRWVLRAVIDPDML
jgi:phosphohistidine phosphatase